MPAIREGLGHGSSAYAGLAGPAWIDFHQLSPSFFRFVREFLKERIPSGVIRRTRQHTSRETFDVQIFNGDYAIPIHQPPFLRLLLKQHLQAAIHRLHQHGAAILRAPHNVVLQAKHCARVLCVSFHHANYISGVELI